MNIRKSAKFQVSKPFRNSLKYYLPLESENVSNTKPLWDTKNFLLSLITDTHNRYDIYHEPSSSLQTKRFNALLHDLSAFSKNPLDEK